MSRTLGRGRAVLLGIAVLVSLVGDEFASLASSFTLADSRLASVGVGILMAAHALPTALFGGRLGRLVDRLNARKVLLAVLPVEGLICVLLSLFHENTYLLLSLVVTLALLGTLAASATFVVIRHLTGDDERLAKYNSAIEVIVGLAMVAGPVVGGVAAQSLGFSTLFLVDGLSFGLAGLLILMVLRVPGEQTLWGQEVERPADEAHFSSPEKEGALQQEGGRSNEESRVERRYGLWSFRVFRTVLPVAMLAMMASSATNVAFVFWVTDRVSGSDRTVAYGLLIAAWSIGNLAGGFLAAKVVNRISLPHLTMIGAVGIGGALLAAGLPINLLAVGTLWVLGGLANAVHNVALRQLVYVAVAEDRLGRGFGQLQSLSAASVLTGHIVGAGTAALFPAGVYFFGGLGGVVVGIIGLVVLKLFPASVDAVGEDRVEKVEG